MSWTIDFQPLGRRIDIQDGQSLLEGARKLVLPDEKTVYAPCGGVGSCGRCRVRIVRGPVTPTTDSEKRIFSTEEMEAGYRLACQVFPLGPLEVEIPAESMAGMQLLQIESALGTVTPEPAVKRYTIPLTPSSLQNPLSVWQQVERFLAEKYDLHSLCFDLALLRETPARAEEGMATVTVRGSRVSDLHRGTAPFRSLGVAVDLGTTKVAGFLIDLESGALLASEGIMNPQIPFGEDVMSRMTYALKEKGNRPRLAQVAADGINRLIRVLLEKTGLSADPVEEVVVAGNTVMHHLLLGLPVAQLARSPYLPALAEPMEVRAREIGLHTAPGAVAHFLSPVAGFVGGDHVAMILAARLHEASDTVLGLDIGTNTEIVLSRNGLLISCSCPSGPAFEGAHIHQGMRAVDGAISRVELADGGRTVTFETIGGRRPIGLCGSGAIDTVAELLSHGVINSLGMLDKRHPRVCASGQGAHFLLVPAADSGLDHDLVFTQKDIGEIQLAKGAIAAGTELLLECAGLAVEEIDRVLVAGAFGTQLHLTSAIAIGLLPNLRLDRFQQVGNAAGAGACMALASLSERRLAAEIARRVQCLELTTRPGFSGAFARSLRFPNGR